MGDKAENTVGGDVLRLAGDAGQDELDRDSVIRAWVFHLLVDAASTVAAVISEQEVGDMP